MRRNKFLATLQMYCSTICTKKQRKSGENFHILWLFSGNGGCGCDLCRKKGRRRNAAAPVFLLFFLTALVVDDGERRFVDEGDALFLGDIHHLLQGGFQEDARDLGEFGARTVRELDVGVDALRRIAHGHRVSLLCLDLFGEGLFKARAPEVGAVAVAVIDGHGREAARLDAVDDGVVIAGLDQDLIDIEDKVCAEFARDAVEVAVGRLIAFEAAGLVEIGVFKRVVPGAFKDLECFGIAVPP